MDFYFFRSKIDDYALLIYSDLQECANVHFLKADSSGICGIKKFVNRVYFSPRIYNYIKLPFRHFFYKKIADKIIYNEKKDVFCLIFSIGWYRHDFILYLRSLFPKIKLILSFTDTFDSKKRLIHFLDADQLKKDFDYIFSYNKDDVKKYGFTYYPVHYSKHPTYNQITISETYDFLYIGAARDRLDIIEDTYKYLKEKGYKCFFYIFTSKKQKPSSEEGITFSNKKLSYIEYLRYFKASKCIIEILNRNTSGNTLRFWECVFYNKILFTNLPNLENQYLYNSKFMFSLDSIKQIDLKKILDINDVDYKYNGEISPKRMLDDIEVMVKKNENID